MFIETESIKSIIQLIYKNKKSTESFTRSSLINFNREKFKVVQVKQGKVHHAKQSFIDVKQALTARYAFNYRWVKIV